MKIIKICALLCLIILVQSCREDDNSETVIPPVTEPKIGVIASVVGTVIDQNGNAITDAAVTYEDKVVYTDELGVFQFMDESLYSSGTYITVIKEGFFNGSRTFYPSAGKTSIVAIELIPLLEVAVFSSSTGSSISFENVNLVFNPNSIVREDGSAYSGNVIVAGKYLDPTLINTLNQMPGDLTGRSIEQNRVSLTSLAMIAVELTDDNGNKLQIEEGKTAEVKIPIPQSLRDNAPSIIPMWHFDEDDGIWIEEGSADLVNGMYETSLGHFSLWNCDVPSDVIFLKGSILNRGIPIQGINVVVSIADGGTSANTITGVDGFFCGFVPIGEDLLLMVYNQCGDLIYEMNISASEIDIFLDPINLLIQTNIVSLSGSVSLCEGDPSEQTYISASQGDLNNIIFLNDDFTFAANVFYCDENSELFVSAVDPVNILISETLMYSIEGNIEVGEIELCEDDNKLIDPRDGEEYDIVEINGRIWTSQNMRYNTDNSILNGFDTVNVEQPEHYGRFYNFVSAESVCPSGWHLPTRAEFEDLVAFIGPSDQGLALKSASDWLNNGNGSNSSGFNAFPAGLYGSTATGFVSNGAFALYWADIGDASSGEGVVLESVSNNINVFYSGTFDSGASVRCIKD